jgi:hypothetical protein
MTARETGAVELERFWEKVDRRGPNECWRWLGTNNGRYGTLSLNGRTEGATRVSWSLANGKPFPEGMCACHTCDNPLCVNPAHLWPGTMRDNMIDAREKGRLPRMNFSHCPKGHALEGENVMIVNGGRHRKCRTCHNESNRKSQKKKRARATLERTRGQ